MNTDSATGERHPGGGVKSRTRVPVLSNALRSVRQALGRNTSMVDQFTV